jgi:type VI protein secretion system component VasK
MQGQIDDAVNKQITNLKSRTANITDANVTSNIDKRITNLQTFETSINNATSLSALQQTLANDNVFVPISDGRMGKNMMHNGGFTRQGNHC